MSKRKIIYDHKHPAIVHLKQSDPVLGEIIEGIGPLEITPDPDHFASLVETIVGQMISMKAAATIYTRVREAAGGALTPDAILALDEGALREAGLSGGKSRAVHELAVVCASGEFDLALLDTLPDEEVSKSLISLRGIGPWSAEMFMIFSLGRQDVFSPGDGGLARALKEIYRVDVSDAEATAKVSDPWSPYRSVACLYLWKTLGNE